MKIVALITAALVFGMLGYIRLAPSDPDAFHLSPSLDLWAANGPWDKVVPARGSASARLTGDAAAKLAGLAAVAEAWPRTVLLAGSVEEGRITWITRSAVFGFPDYTTADARDDGLYIWARLRFGTNDHGVNAARLQSWISQL